MSNLLNGRVTDRKATINMKTYLYETKVTYHSSISGNFSKRKNFDNLVDPFPLQKSQNNNPMVHIHEAYNPLIHLSNSGSRSKVSGSKNQKNLKLTLEEDYYLPSVEKLIEADKILSSKNRISQNFNNLSITKIGSAKHHSDLPKNHQGLNRKLAPEIAIIGSANSGKSTFVSQFFKNEFKNLYVPAVSDRAGMTGSLEFYQINELLTVVDTPGFGQRQPSAVNDALVPYLIDQSRKTLKHVIYLISIDPTSSTIEPLTNNHVKVLKLLKNHLPNKYTIVINKIDLITMSPSTRIKAVIDFINLCKSKNLGKPRILLASGKSGEGMPLIKALIVDKATDGKFLDGFDYKEEYFYDHSRRDSIDVSSKKFQYAQLRRSSLDGAFDDGK